LNEAHAEKTLRDDSVTTSNSERNQSLNETNESKRRSRSIRKSRNSKITSSDLKVTS